MELKKRSLRYYETVLSTSVQREESSEVIVPDNSPDIDRVVQTAGMACLKEKYARDGRLELSGLVRATVLYLPEGGTGLRKMEVNLPFSHTLEHHELDGEVHVYVKSTLMTADTRLLNPRKVQVSAAILLEIEVMRPGEWEVCESVDEAEDHGLQMLTTTQSAHMPIAVKEKEFSVVDELELPGSKPPVANIMMVGVQLAARDVKVIGDKMVFKGAAQLKICYAGPAEGDSDAEIACFEQELPFSQILEMEGLEESCDCSVDLQLSGLELDIRTGAGFDTRVLGVTLQVDAYAVATLERRVEALTDLYSTTHDCKPLFKPYHFSQFVGKTVKRQAVREVFETGTGVHAVLDTQIVLSPALMLEEEDGRQLSCEANVKVLYMGDDMGYYSVGRRVQVTCPMEGDGPVVPTASLAGEIFGAGTSDGMEIRFAVDFEMAALQSIEMNTLSGLELETEPETAARRPSVVLKRVRGGERLWDIAKRYRTTAVDIQKANGLAEDELVGGKMLLIPRKR